MKLKSFLGWTLAIIIVLVLVGVAAIKLLFSPQKIVATLIPRVQDVLERPIEYGDVDVSVFSGIGFTIHEIKVKNDPGFMREDFLRIGRVDCLLKVWPLLRGDVEIKRLILVDPELYLIKNPDGVTNYYGTEEDINAPGDEQALAALLGFEEFDIYNGRLIDRNDSTGVKWVAGGIDFHSEVGGTGDLSIAGKLEADSLGMITGLEDFVIYPADFTTDFDMSYFEDGDSLLVDKFEFSLSDLSARITGRITALQTAPNVDLAVIAPRVKLRNLETTSLVNAFPPLRDLRLDGQLRLDASYKGLLHEPDADNLRGKVTLSNLWLSSPRLDADIEAQLAELNFNSQSVSFFTEDARIGDVPATFRMAVDDFSDPNISAEVNFKSGLGLISQLAQLDPDSRLEGTAEVSLSGFMRWKERENLRLLGSIKFSDASVSSPRLAMPINKLDLSCQFLGKDAEIQSMDFEAGDTRFQAEGTLLNFSDYVASLGKTARKPLLDFELKADAVDLDQLLSQGEFESDSAADSTAVLPLIALFPAFDASGHLKIDRATFGGADLRDVNSRFLMLSRIVQIDSAECKAFKGNVEGEVIADLSVPGSPDWEIDVNAHRIEIDNLLSQVLNYPDHIRGRADLIAEFKRGTSTSDTESVTGSGSILIPDGELKDLSPLITIADRLGMRSLEKKDFNGMRGRFTYSDSALELSDLSLTQGKISHRINGVIDFNGDLDLTLESTVPASEANSLNLPEQFRDMWKRWQGASLTFHIGGTAESPSITLADLQPARGGTVSDVENLRNILDSLLGN
jgi:hypothetical protein